MVEVQLPENETVMKFQDEQACSLLMVWWEKQIAEKFWSYKTAEQLKIMQSFQS